MNVNQATVRPIVVSQPNPAFAGIKETPSPVAFKGNLLSDAFVSAKNQVKSINKESIKSFITTIAPKAKVVLEFIKKAAIVVFNAVKKLIPQAASKA